MRDDKIIPLGRRANPTGAAEGGSTEAYRRPPAAPSDLQMLRRKRAEFEAEIAGFERALAAFEAAHAAQQAAGAALIEAYKGQIAALRLERMRPGMTARSDGTD